MSLSLQSDIRTKSVASPGPHRTAAGPVLSKASRYSRASLEVVDPFTDQCVHADREEHHTAN
jgi:hypothetical protein